MKIWAIIYNIFIIPILSVVYFFLKLFDKKIKVREKNYKFYIEKIPKKRKNKLRVLIHSSSMGEFEQAKPLIERLKRNSKNIEIIASFYSPSGLENQKDYQYVDYVVYMPFDSLSNAKEYTKLTNPDLVIFIRYDLWRNHISLFNYSYTPLILINASKPSSIISKIPLISSFYNDVYSLFNEIYTLGEKHTEYFKSLNIKTKIYNSADTRYDRIIEKVYDNINSDIIDKKLFNNKIVLVLGSSWKEEEEMLAKCFEQFKNSIFPIIVPHEPTKEHISHTLGLFPNSLLLSEYNLGKDYNVDCLIVDSIGKLLSIYSFADFALVGGGFGKSVHSLSEPAGYSIPLGCGPNIERSPEAEDLKTAGALKIIENTNDLVAFLEENINEKQRKETGLKSGNFIKSKLGSTNLILQKILQISNKKDIKL